MKQPCFQVTIIAQTMYSSIISLSIELIKTTIYTDSYKYLCLIQNVIVWKSLQKLS